MVTSGFPVGVGKGSRGAHPDNRVIKTIISTNALKIYFLFWRCAVD
jgi:hypothetical protein